MTDHLTKILLSEDQIPTHWNNISADLPNPAPPHLHPGTQQPVKADDLAAIFPPGLIEQELSTERWIEIPEEVREIYRLWRPAPMYRAYRLEAALGTKARV